MHSMYINSSISFRTLIDAPDKETDPVQSTRAFGNYYARNTKKKTDYTMINRS